MLLKRSIPLHRSCFFILLLFAASASAQDNPFIKLTDPLKENISVSSSRQFIMGSTCKACSISINDTAVKVYSTGAFVYELNINSDTSFNIVATNSNGKRAVKKLAFSYRMPSFPDTVKTAAIASIQTFPEGNLVLLPGDKIQLKVKALPGSNVTTYNNTVLYEMPVKLSGGMPGIYQGEYIVKPSDDFSAQKFTVTLVSPAGEKAARETSNSFAVMSALSSDVALTKGRLAHLEYGLGDDRLGGAKIGYLDSLIPLKIIGKVAQDYKVRLAPNRTAYIPDDLVELMPKGSFMPASLTGQWKVYGDSTYDYVNIGLTARLAYQSMQLIDPSRIVVDIYGATNNTSWITQLENTREITNVDYEQLQDEVVRVTIQLKHAQHWGYDISYKGSLLVIRVKQQPASLALNKLTIAIDAGHGGSNTGAGGPAGSSEKAIALALSLKLQAALEKEGVKVLMTRTTETFVDNKERILLYRDNRPDLLISIHLNSSSDPIRAGGTSTLYRYTGFRSLSESINKRMLELGLKEYGNIGSFNFMLNSPTEYPNALIEALFLSNPAEEALILDEGFQQKMVNKIVQGIRDFLAQSK